MSEKKQKTNIQDLTICKSTARMLERTRRDGVETAFDRAADMRACPIGEKSACCKHCAMGPCRLNANDPYAKKGVCGASVDTIQSRNFARMVASGTAAHSSHGMNMLNLFKDVINGKAPDYSIRDVAKLKAVAEALGIETDNKSTIEIARELCDVYSAVYLQTDGEIPYCSRVPEGTLESWRKAGIVPRGAMIEVMELIQRTHAGMDQDYRNLTTQINKTALVDGWGGSMMATDISDILFGTPSATNADVDMGCLKEDHVNIIINGHEPYLLDSIQVSVNQPELLDHARKAGAK